MYTSSNGDYLLSTKLQILSTLETVVARLLVGYGFHEISEVACVWACGFICVGFNFLEYFKVNVGLFKIKLPPKQGRIRNLCEGETVVLFQVKSTNIL